MSTRLRAALLLAVVACSSTQDCTSADCNDGIRVLAPVGAGDWSNGTITVCIDGQCEEVGFGTGEDVATVERDRDGGEQVTATLEMPDGTRYEASGEVENLRPNGPDCGPVCDAVELQLG